MPTLFHLFSLLPLWLLHGLGAVLGWLVFCVSGTYRRRFLQNARQAGYRFADVRAAVGHAGRLVAELPRMWLQDKPPPCEMVRPETVERAWARGRGGLLVAQAVRSARPVGGVRSLSLRTCPQP